ncbi:MAG: cell wall metabolism sensor histidine kinase WalK [Clostridia bacterium]|nr:cell wall metabolism sensor histidine kinase WalK [Clostridia bacterium]
MALRRLLVSLLRSLQWRLVFIFIAMTISLIIPIGIMLKVQVEKSVYNEFKADIINGMGFLEDKPYGSIEDLWNIMQKKGENYSTYYFNMGSEHKTFSILNTKALNKVLSSDPVLNGNENQAVSEILESENFISALGNKEGTERNLRHLNGKAFFDCAMKKGEFIIYFRYYSQGWENMMRGFNNIIITSLMFSIIISLILGYILSKTITVPVVNLMHKAQDVAKGNFDKLLEVKSEDEIGKLTKTFNYMAGELKNTMTEISSEKNKIETILKYMTDGIIAYNIKGEVVHVNPAARKLLGVNSIEMSFNEFSGKYSLGMSLEEIEYLNFSGNKEVNIVTEDKYIKAYFAIFTDEEDKAEGIIIVLQDVTEQQKIENMRKEFVANVSHELRTPLTSIKSYTETLLDGAMEDRETTERFLGVVNSEADRMTRLVKDLLQLTRLDNQQMQWKLQPVSPVSLIKKSIEKLELEAKNKDQELGSYIIGDIPNIKADADRMEQVVLNILSNAIKYTPAGGKITVYTSKLYEDVCIKIVDTGIGIPEKDLPRIFERFYRVDKARSREMGGTGLGLAIAKEIVEAHNGSISISSEWGKGTEVTIKLPSDKEDDNKPGDNDKPSTYFP